MLSRGPRRLVLVALCCLAVVARAGLAPENVAVVVNGDSVASLTVAEEYARLRGIPSDNFVVLRGLSSIDVVDVDRFRSEILAPVFDTLARRGRLPHIDCIAYSVDVPYAVEVGADMTGKRLSQVITGTASTNGLTYLHEHVLNKDSDYLSLTVNRYARRLLPLPKGASFTAAERAKYADAMDLYNAKKYAEAAAALEKLLAGPHTDAGAVYDLACCQALAGKPDAAVQALKKAVTVGWRSYGMATSDADLASLAARPDFQELIASLRAAPLRIQSGVGFRSSTAWDDTGAPGLSGPRYMLSTMLGVTCGRGNSVAEVLDCLRRAASADFSSPTGTIYFMKNGDVRSTTREWGFNPAVDAIGRLGVRAVVEEGVLPQNSDGVAGAMIGSAGFDWVSCHSTILPGAICEHLTSFGGIIAERADQTPCTDLIRAGAAGTSGTVTEPYALQQKFPTPFIQLQYVQGFTLAEAFYLSLSGPYQLLVVGDPLCKPWAKPLRVSVSGLPAGGIVKEALSLKATVSRPADVATFELYVDGKFAAQAQPGTPLKLETAGLPAGYHALSVVAVENNPAESRARVSMPVTIARRGESVGEFGPKSRSAALGEKVAVTLSCGGASSIDVVQFGRTLATVQGAKGTATVDTNDLGIGAAQLVPVAHVAGGEVMGAPIEVVVDQPAPGTPSAESGAATEPGLVLTTGGSRAVVQDTFDSAWLSKLCPGPAQSFVLAGDFEAPKDELYQVQIRTNTRALVEIDGSKAASVGDEKWHCVLVALRAGNHALAVHGVAPAGAVLDVRLGAAGAYHLAAQRFHHLLR